MAEDDAVDQAKTWLANLGVSGANDADVSQGASNLVAGREPSDPVGHTLPPELRSTGSDPGAPREGDPESVAKAIVVGKLSLRAHTRAELEKALRTRLVPEEIACVVLDRMVSLGLVDDQGFARDWVDSRQQRRHLSRRALQQELTRKGVQREQIDAALQRVDRDDELTAARTLADKKRSTLLHLDRDVGYRRLAGVLGRRGFSADVVSTVLRETFGNGRVPTDA